MEASQEEGGGFDFRFGEGQGRFSIGLKTGDHEKRVLAGEIFRRQD